MKENSYQTVVGFPNNVFDRLFYSEKEIIEVVENFIKTVYLLGISTEREATFNLETIYTMKKLGLVKDESDLIELEKLLGVTLYNELIGTVNFLTINEELLENKDIQKYCKEKRENLIRWERKIVKPTLVDLFCGSGGLSLGFIQSGFKVVFANDIEQSALRTYSFNHPEINGARITKGGIEGIAHNVSEYIKENVDVLVGGPPCQGFSTANRQRLIEDPRNILYKYYVEAVKNLAPKFFVMENVKGMKVVANQVIEDFNENIPVGYNIAYELFNAKKFGIPQNRERLIYIGVRKDICSEQSITALDIINEIKNDFDNLEQGVVIALDRLPKLEASTMKNATSNESKLSGGKIVELKNRSSNEYINSINLNTPQNLIFNHKARYNNDRDIEIFNRMLPGDKSDSPRIADIMPYKSRSHMFKDKYYKLIPNIPCKTITAHMKYDCNMYIHPDQGRGLTPREAARVQSYPDDYFFLGPYTKTYQQIGNSVPPMMARKIAEKIVKYL